MCPSCFCAARLWLNTNTAPCIFRVGQSVDSPSYSLSDHTVCVCALIVHQQMRDMESSVSIWQTAALFSGAECCRVGVQHGETHALLCFTFIYSLQQRLILLILGNELKIVSVPVDVEDVVLVMTEDITGSIPVEVDVCR